MQQLTQNKTKLLTVIIIPSIVAVLVGMGLAILIFPDSNLITGHKTQILNTYGWDGALVPGTLGTIVTDNQELVYLQTITKNSHGNINAGLWSQGTPDTFYLTAKHGSGLINYFVVKNNERYFGVHVLDSTYGDWYPGIGTPNYDVILFQIH